LSSKITQKFTKLVYSKRKLKVKINNIQQLIDLQTHIITHDHQKQEAESE